MKAQWIILIVVGALAVLGAAAFFLFMKGPELSSYLPLKEPRIVHKDRERVLEVEFSGAAETAVPKASALLFKTYFRLKGSPKGPAMKPPKARYQIPVEKDGSVTSNVKDFMAHAWTGSFAIPIPEALAVPEQKPDADGMVARAGEWDYGDTAEILHLGPYEAETAAIRELLDYIAAKGYKEIGDHEEEYLKGPGMGKIDPKDYWTIIRYRVEKAN
jgi:hypothetical protein